MCEQQGTGQGQCQTPAGYPPPPWPTSKEHALKSLPDSVTKPEKPSALDVQEGGDHYKTLKIQPIEYIHANGIPFAEGCVIKYLTRWRDKGGLEDLRKARHFIDLLIDLETRSGRR